MLMLSVLIILAMVGLLVWDLAGQPTGRRWRRRRRNRGLGSRSRTARKRQP